MFLRILILLFPCLLIAAAPFQQFHNSTYQLGWDIHWSPYAGGEDILFAHRILERAEGYLIGLSPIYHSRAPSARFWRFNELFLGWLPVNYLAMVAQHEVFGHGYRIRDINRGRAKVEGYDFNAPPPYGPGGAVTQYDVGENLTLTEETAIAMAGVESTAILAQLTKLKWLESHWIDPRQTALYLLGQHDLNLYIGTLKALDDESLKGHDIYGYIKSLNYTYTNGSLSQGRLRSLSWINLADPFTFYSIYAWFYYIYTGKETRIPMIPIYNMGYLPSVRLGLTPFGPEFFIENYLRYENRPIYFYLKGGFHSDNSYLGAGFFAPRIWSIKQWFFGLRIDAWRQPKLLLNPVGPFLEINFHQKPDRQNPLYSYSEQHKMTLGAGTSILIAYYGRSGFEAELGYKSSGFLPGYALRASPTVRLYYTLVF